MKFFFFDKNRQNLTNLKSICMKVCTCNKYYLRGYL